MRYARTEIATKLMPLLRHRFSQNAGVVNVLVVFTLCEAVMADVEAPIKLSFAPQCHRCSTAGASRQRVVFDYRFRSRGPTTVVVLTGTTRLGWIALPVLGMCLTRSIAIVLRQEED